MGFLEKIFGSLSNKIFEKNYKGKYYEKSKKE